MANIAEQMQDMDFATIEKTLSAGGVDTTPQQQAETENKKLSTEELEEVKKVVAEKAKEEEIPPAEQISQTYEWSPEEKCLEISEALLTRAMEEANITHFGGIPRFEDPAEILDERKHTGDPPRFWIKPIEKDGEPTNEMMIICQLNDNSYRENVTMTMAHVTHESGRITEKLLTLTQTKADLERLATIPAKLKRKDKNKGIEPLSDEEQALKIYVSGEVTADVYMNEIMPEFTDRTLTEYHDQRDETLHLVPESGLANEQEGEILAKIEGKYTKLLQTIDQNNERIKKEGEAKQKTLEKNVSGFRANGNFREAFKKYIDLSPANRKLYARFLIEDYGATQKELDYMEAEARKRNRIKGAKQGAATKRARKAEKAKEAEETKKDEN